MDLTRKQVIEILEQFCNSLDMLSENKLMQALDYAISSLKTDEAYQIMYEGGEVFTVDEVIAMLADIKSKIKDVYVSDNGERFIRMTCRDYVQEKINDLEGR